MFAAGWNPGLVLVFGFEAVDIVLRVVASQ